MNSIRFKNVSLILPSSLAICNFLLWSRPDYHTTYLKYWVLNIQIVCSTTLWFYIVYNSSHHVNAVLFGIDMVHHYFLFNRNIGKLVYLARILGQPKKNVIRVQQQSAT